jgi:DNA-binding response OmpR family regulator
MRFSVWLLIADEARAGVWQDILRRSGWPVVRLADPEDLGREAAAASGLVLVDEGVLGDDPVLGLRKLKPMAGAMPLILISAARLADQALIAALDAGADDYFPDSLDPRLVLAKLNSHLRRVLPQVTGALDTVLAPGGDLKLERRSRSVLVKTGGRWTPLATLTPTEAKLLSLFLARPGLVLERRYLLEAVWREEAEAALPAIVDKHVEALRRKLGAHGRRIRTVYGTGYILKEDAS